MKIPSIVSLALLIAGCGASPTEPTTQELEPGLGEAGSVALALSEGGVLITAPLFPDATVFQAFQDPSAYPALTEAERTALIDHDVRTFEQLLPLCAAKDPTITLPAAGETLTAEQIAVNYDAVARCGYEDYGAKPYWVPQQVLDVDICARKLGARYGLMSEANLAMIPESAFEELAQILGSLAGSGSFPNHFYYSLDAYVLGGDGTLKLGDLRPNVTHVLPLPVSGEVMNELYLGDGKPIGLRCVSVVGTSN